MHTFPQSKVNVLSDEIEAEFCKLADKWRSETLFLSSAHQMAQNANYQEIIRLGLPAVPLILREMQEKPGHWFWALHAITNENPVGSAAGFDAATEAWLQWGRQKGYIK